MARPYAFIGFGLSLVGHMKLPSEPYYAQIVIVKIDVLIAHHVDSSIQRIRKGYLDTRKASSNLHKLNDELKDVQVDKFMPVGLNLLFLAYIYVNAYHVVLLNVRMHTNACVAAIHDAEH